MAATPDLGRVPMFKSVPLNGLSALAQRGQRRVFAAGDVLMRQGDPSDCMHVILGGLVRVQRVHPELVNPVFLAQLGPGTTVGEMGVLDEMPRSATVTATEETETLELSAQALVLTIQEYPAVAASLLHILSRRLRSTDELLGDMLHRRDQG